MSLTPEPEEAPDASGLAEVAGRLGAVIRHERADWTGWRWRCGWRGIEMGAWNDIDGVAVVADIGPWDDWVGLQGHPPDPTPGEALAWAVDALGLWLTDPDRAEQMAARLLDPQRRPDAGP